MKPLLALFIFLQSICATAQRVVSYEGTLHTFKLHLDSAAGAGKKKYDCHIKLVLVYDKTNGSLVQTITPPENSFLCTAATGKVFLMQDINFDGITDLMIPQFAAATPNISYYYWKFNGKTQQFQRDTTLEDITSPDFEPTEQVITSFWRRNATDNGVSTYKYLDGQLTLVEETELSPDPDNAKQQIFTRKKLINGDLKLVEESTEKMESDPVQKLRKKSGGN